MDAMKSAFAGVTKAIRWSFADVLAYLLLGAAVLTLALGVIVGASSLASIVESYAVMSVGILALFGYPIGFLLSLVGDVTADGVRGVTRRFKRSVRPTDDSTGAGVDEQASFVLVNFLFSSLEESQRPAPADLDGDNTLWMAETAATLAPDRLPAWTAGFERTVGLLRFTTAVLGTAALGVTGFGLAAVLAGFEVIPTPLLPLLGGAVLSGLVIPFAYVVASRMNGQLTRTIIQVGVAIAAQQLHDREEAHRS